MSCALYRVRSATATAAKSLPPKPQGLWKPDPTHLGLAALVPRGHGSCSTHWRPGRFVAAPEMLGGDVSDLDCSIWMGIAARKRVGWSKLAALPRPSVKKSWPFWIWPPPPFTLLWYLGFYPFSQCFGPGASAMLDRELWVKFWVPSSNEADARSIAGAFPSNSPRLKTSTKAGWAPIIFATAISSQADACGLPESSETISSRKVRRCLCTRPSTKLRGFFSFRLQHARQIAATATGGTFSCPIFPCGEAYKRTREDGDTKNLWTYLKCQNRGDWRIRKCEVLKGFADTPKWTCSIVCGSETHGRLSHDQRLFLQGVNPH